MRGGLHVVTVSKHVRHGGRDAGVSGVATPGGSSARCVSPGIASIRRRLARQAEDAKATAAAATKLAVAANLASTTSPLTSETNEVEHASTPAAATAPNVASEALRTRIGVALSAAGCEGLRVGETTLGELLVRFGDVPLETVLKQGSLDGVLNPVQRGRLLRALAGDDAVSRVPLPSVATAAPTPAAASPTSSAAHIAVRSPTSATAASPSAARLSKGSGSGSERAPPSQVLHPGAFVYLLSGSAATLGQVVDVGPVPRTRTESAWYKVVLFSELLPRSSADVRLWSPTEAVLVERGASLALLPAGAVAFDAELRVARVANCVVPRAPPLALNEDVARALVDPLVDAHFYFILSLARRDGSAEEDARLVADVTHCLRECLEAERVSVRIVSKTSAAARVECDVVYEKRASRGDDVVVEGGESSPSAKGAQQLSGALALVRQLYARTKYVVRSGYFRERFVYRRSLTASVGVGPTIASLDLTLSATVVVEPRLYRIKACRVPAPSLPPWASLAIGDFAFFRNERYIALTESPDHPMYWVGRVVGVVDEVKEARLRGPSGMARIVRSQASGGGSSGSGSSLRDRSSALPSISLHALQSKVRTGEQHRAVASSDGGGSMFDGDRELAALREAATLAVGHGAQLQFDAQGGRTSSSSSPRTRSGGNGQGRRAASVSREEVAVRLDARELGRCRLLVQWFRETGFMSSCFVQRDRTLEVARSALVPLERLTFDAVANVWMMSPGSLPAWLPVPDSIEGFDGLMPSESESEEEQLEKSSDGEISSSEDGELSESTSDSEWEETRRERWGSSTNNSGQAVSSSYEFSHDERGRRVSTLLSAERAVVLSVLKRADLTVHWRLLCNEGYDTLPNLRTLTAVDAKEIGMSAHDAEQLIEALKTTPDPPAAALAPAAMRRYSSRTTPRAPPPPLPPPGAVGLPPVSFEATLGIDFEGLAGGGALPPRPPARRPPVVGESNTGVQLGGGIDDVIDAIFA